MCAVTACARTDISGITTKTDGDGGSGDDCAPAGIRICRAGCPDVATTPANASDAGETCPGYGCTSPLDIVAFAPTAAGVCWADGTDVLRYACGSCADGEVCIQRSSTELACVPEAVCASLWNHGVRDVCRYADFSPYDGRPLPTTTGSCPSNAYPPTVCSGECPACLADARCNGRSPDHPFGVCNATGFSDPLPSQFLGCPTCFEAQQPNTVCAVFDGSTADFQVAYAGGFCMDRQRCFELGKALPGGLSCFDANETRLGP